ncbi:MAG: ABC transporter ATP-binding protein/permease [Lachnospiraceae bacterium]|nr:ABC transporter ATP-binding protein/permease [Lachnospiraceae bacterium]
MKSLLKYFKGYRKECIIGPLFKLLEAGFELIIPLVVKQMIDKGIAAGDVFYVLKMAGIMIMLGIIGLICSLTAQYFCARAAVYFAEGVKHDMFERVMKLSYQDTDGIGVSALITRLTSDINALQGGVNMSLRLLLRSPFVVFGAVVTAFTIDVKAACIFTVTVVILTIIVAAVMFITGPGYRAVQERLDKVLLSVRSSLNGVRVIRAFGNEEREFEAFKKENDELNRLQIFTGRISALLNPFTFIVINLGTAWLIWDGALAVDTGRLSRGAVVALVNLMGQILVELIKLANLIVQLSRALACANRIEDLLKKEPSMKEGKTGLKIKGKAPEVIFEDVCMSYAGAGENALEGVSFKADPGSTTGIIGGTGSGKSTMVNLIPRFYDVSSGCVKVDGIDVRELKFADLREAVAVVPQKSVLFEGTIKDNMRLGKEDASDEEIISALKTAQAYDFVMEKEGGLEAPVTQGGDNFSGGQRQRLCIARALVKKPEILIMDDSASALDYATDAALRKAIGEMKDAPTVFIVSQRAASVMHADRIIVLDEGHIAASGTHDELLKSCDIYREIYVSQFGRPEGSD